MNEEGEYIKRTACQFCVRKEDSPKCMWIKRKGKCKYFEKKK